MSVCVSMTFRECLQHYLQTHELTLHHSPEVLNMKTAGHIQFYLQTRVPEDNLPKLHYTDQDWR
jgi:hypothetical protein